MRIYNDEFFEKLTTDENDKNVKNFQNQHSEKFSLFLFALAAVSTGINAFSIKYLKFLFPQEFDPYALSFWRSVLTTIIFFFAMRSKKIEILDLRKVENKFWLGVRTIGQFINYISFLFCIMYLRIGTANSIGSMNPALVVLISTFLLKEQFHMRYFYGILICFIGTLFIVNNDRGIDTNKNMQGNDFGFIFGCFCGLIYLITLALFSISSKILTQEKIGYENQCFYLGVSNTILSIVFIFLFGTFKTGIPFIIGSLLSTIFFLLQIVLLIEATKNVDLNKTTPLAYLTTVTVFALGVTILEEPIFLTDVIGSLIILGYNVYNSIYSI